jgi:pimeloyl-ACP methyl ester carboxylesterase
LEARTLFLPGASGSAVFWKPAALRAGLDGEFLGWPGLGDEPAHPEVNSIGDLVAMVLDHMDEPVNIVAQSMGGVVAIMAALAKPAKVNRLVLAVTSGGVPVADLGGAEWRSNYRRKFPHAGRWTLDAGSPSRCRTCRHEYQRPQRQPFCCGAIAIRSAQLPSAGA